MLKKEQQHYYRYIGRNMAKVLDPNNNIIGTVYLTLQANDSLIKKQTNKFKYKSIFLIITMLIIFAIADDANARIVPPKRPTTIISRRNVNLLKVHGAYTVLRGTRHAPSTSKND